MKRLTILVDMDDTIINLLDAWVDRLNRSYGTEVKAEDVTQWNIAKSFPSLTSEQVYSPLLCDDFWYNVLPKEGAAEALRQLINDGHKVLIVTSSLYQTLRTKMDVTLFGYFPFITWKDVIITGYISDIAVDEAINEIGKVELCLMKAVQKLEVFTILFIEYRHGFLKVSIHFKRNVHLSFASSA